MKRFLLVKRRFVNFVRENTNLHPRSSYYRFIGGLSNRKLVIEYSDDIK